MLWALVGALAAVAILLGAGGAWLINGIVEKMERLSLAWRPVAKDMMT